MLVMFYWMKPYIPCILGRYGQWRGTKLKSLFGEAHTGYISN